MGGQAAGNLPRAGNADLLYLCGGGIMAHPGGAAAGVAAIRQAWEAALAGMPLSRARAETHPELRTGDRDNSAR